VSYDLASYGAMVADRVRMAAYEEALRRVVTPASLVLDIGAGPGIMSLIAARLGARRVIAVEPNPLVRIAGRLAAENGYAERIVVVHGRSQQLELAEKADVVVADLRGGLPNHAGHVEALADARERLLKPEGVLIPMRDTIVIAPVDAAEAHAKLLSPWLDNPFGLAMTGAADAIANQGALRLSKPGRLLGPGRPVAVLDYRKVTTPSLDAAVDLEVAQAGVVHGLSIWFEAELVPGVVFSTAPDLEETVYGRLFLPLRLPLEVDVGDRLRVTVKAALDDDLRLWIWRGRLEGADGARKARFTASSAFHNPESPVVVDALGAGAAPRLTEDGRIVREVLDRFDGARSVAEVAASIVAEHPGRFELVEDAVAFVRDVAERYGEATLRLEG
jgi:SAM-dependent methyltransferase